MSRFDPPPLGEHSFSVELRASLEGLGERIDRLKPPEPILPIFGRSVGSVTIPASGFAVVDLGGPEGAHVRYVRRIAISGSAPGVALGGRGDVYVTANQSMATAASFAGVDQSAWEDQATTLPLVGTYGRGELIVKGNEHLFVVISSGTPGQIAYVVTRFEEIALIPGAVSI